jgi:hypothetical protein
MHFAKPTEYHVAPAGSDQNPGTQERPLRTIASAAARALPGDTVTVHAGTYREWVSPCVGGVNACKRITYQAARDEEVVIKGSERIQGWTRKSGNVWQVTLPNRFFGNYNPYLECISGDWFQDKGRVHHTGDVYLDGVSLFEVESLETVESPRICEQSARPEASLRTWFATVDDRETTIYANFQSADPNTSLVEINVRPACFFPRTTGVDYITVRRFRMCHAATTWAPPTAEQPGLIGPNWSKGWIIEDNIIHDSRCSGISLGKERGSGHNRWTRERHKHGTQREREVIFRALQMGWSKETVGSHVVRNNTIYNCEQAGIVGHLGCIFSEISGNHIFDIHVKGQFEGAEIAGIKLHAAIDVQIRGNHIHHTGRGIWLDWQAQGTRVSRNVLYSNSSEDLFIEVSHGPCVVDNNLLLSAISFRNVNQGTALVHNLIAGKMVMRKVPRRFTPYHFPHSTQVLGLMTILGGDDKWVNNIFVNGLSAGDYVAGSELDVGDKTDGQDELHDVIGLSAYNGFPLEYEEWGSPAGVGGYAELELPVRIDHNVYASGTEPFKREDNPVVLPGWNPAIKLESRDDKVFLHINVHHDLAAARGPLVTTELLGEAFQPEVPYEEPDGSPLVVDVDYLGRPRLGAAVTPGPFATLASGPQVIPVIERGTAGWRTVFGR